MLQFARPPHGDHARDKFSGIEPISALRHCVRVDLECDQRRRAGRMCRREQRRGRECSVDRKEGGFVTA